MKTAATDSRQVYWKRASHVAGDEKASPYRILLYSLLALGCLAGIGFWASHAVWESIVNVYSDKLRVILNADVEALDIWVKNELDRVKYITEDKDLRRDVEEIVGIYEKYPNNIKKLREASPVHEIRDRFLTEISDADYLGYFIIGRDGTILASNAPERHVGLTLSRKFMDDLKHIFAGPAVFRKPFLKGTYLEEIDVEADKPIILVASPIRNQNDEVIASFGFALDPDKDFTRIISVARMSESGDTYAFDENGFLLSDSRFEEQLKSIGLLPATPQARSILSVQIRDPGGDLTRGFRPKNSIQEWPFTRMAAAAISGNSGVDISGYRDYRGVMVIGAWRWLPEYGFGIATEVRKDVAFKGYRPVRLAFIGLFIVMVIVCAWLFYSSLSIQRLKTKIDEVKQLGQYSLEEKLGEGGMGKVYKAKHAMLKRPTAVKFLKPEEVSDETLQRFEREVQKTSSLTHPNTIQVYDYGMTDDGIFYYAMEYLRGIDLAQLIEIDGQIPPQRVIYIIKRICYSLEEAHGVGLIHRDIKPMNIMLCERCGKYDAVKVLDFGLVKDIENPQNQDLTANQGVIGTPVYIAPERLEGKSDIDARSDFYSLGAVAFNLLTGKDVFEASTTMEVCYHVMKSRPPRPSQKTETEIPSVLDQLVYDCLAKEPDDRPSSAREIIKILEALEAEREWTQDDALYWWKENKTLLEKIIDHAGVR